MALWTVRGDRSLSHDGVISPEERCGWLATVGLGVQHLVVMFGATAIVPLVTGLPLATTLLFSGIGTLVFLVVTRNRVPAYLASSYAFIAPLVAARSGGIVAALGTVLVAGLLLVVVGIGVKALGVRLLDSVMPPVVAGAVVVLVGLSLAPVAAHNAAAQPALALVTLVVIGLCAVRRGGLAARFAVFVGIAVGWVVGAVAGGIGPDKMAAVRAAAWIGLPVLHHPQLRSSAMLLVLPAVLVLVAQNVGHVKAIATITGRDLDGNIGDVLIANGLATTLAGVGGGSAVTTSPQNIGVMAVSRVYSTATYVVTALLVIVLSFSPKIDAVLGTVPIGVCGGAALVLFGLVGLQGVRIWRDNGVDLADPLNQIVVGTAVVAGVGDVTVSLGSVPFGGVIWGSVLIVLGHPVLRMLRGMRQ